MYSQALKAAFKARLLVYATAQAIAVDWGDMKNFNPVKESWLRPRLLPSPTKPGPSQLGPLRATFRGIYAVECMTPIEAGDEAPNELADAIANHFMPSMTEPVYLDTSSSGIRTHLYVPSVLELPPLDIHNRAAVHVPYLVYAIA